MLGSICAVGDTTLCFRESFENSTTYCVVQLMLDFLLSCIILPQISQSLSLSYFTLTKTLWWIYKVHTVALCDKYNAFTRHCHSLM